MNAVHVTCKSSSLEFTGRDYLPVVAAWQTQLCGSLAFEVVLHDWADIASMGSQGNSDDDGVDLTLLGKE